jgi:hypothetical protein
LKPKLVFTLLVLIFLAVSFVPQRIGSSRSIRFQVDGDTISYLPIVVLKHPSTHLVADHYAVDALHNIPDNYITYASQLRMLFRHASVGQNISDGLDCLANNTIPRPYSCDADLTPSQIYYHPQYNRSNWVFEFHSPPPGQNPGWNNKVDLFIDRINHLTPAENYRVVGFKFGYVDGYAGSDIDDKFFNNDPNDNLPSIEDLEALEAANPNRILMYWTMGLARQSAIDSQNFNQRMRSYAQVHGKALMDIADILSHTPSGAPCYDIDGLGVEAICDEYTDETYAGHLNALGSQRMAKAIWWMMARLAGWGG